MDFLQNVLSGIVLLIIGGVAGYIKGKKKSALAIERKNNIFLPLINEITPLSNFNINILHNINTPLLSNIVLNDYKFGLHNELNYKCRTLYSFINSFNEINLIEIAREKIIYSFETGFKDLFDSIISDVQVHKEDDIEWEEEILVEPIDFIQNWDFNHYIKQLLNNEGIYNTEIYIDEGNGYYEPVFQELLSIYNTALNIRSNNIKYELPTLKKNILTTPAEYIALHYDVIKMVNHDDRFLMKEDLKEKIIFKCQEIIIDLKEIIKKIVKAYEVEEI